MYDLLQSGRSVTQPTRQTYRPLDNYTVYRTERTDSDITSHETPSWILFLILFGVTEVEWMMSTYTISAFYQLIV